MTVAATITAVQALGNGSATQFSFNNKVFQASDLVVTLIDLSGNQYTFAAQANTALGLSYTVQNVDVDTGCLVVFNNPPALNWTIDIRTAVPQTQPTSIKNQGAFLPELHEEAFDRLTRELQDLRRLAYAFSVHGPDTESTPWPTLPGPSGRLGLALMFDSILGQLTLGTPVAGTITGPLIASLLNQTNNIAPIASLLATQFENAAGVTIVNFSYPPGHVDRYGTNAIPGSSSMTAAFQAAINQAKVGGAPIVWGETGVYVLDAPLNCTNTNFGLTFRQIAARATNPPPPQGSVQIGALWVKHSGYAVFDLAGCVYADFHDLSLVTQAPPQPPVPTANLYPQWCFFLARTTFGSGAFAHFRNTSIQGYFSGGILYNYASELGVYSDNDWQNYAADAGAVVGAITANNYFKGASPGLTSNFATVLTGAQSCLSHEFRGGSYVMLNASSTSDLFYLEGGVDKPRFNEFWCALSNANGTTHGRAFIYNETVNGGANRIQVHGVKLENSTTQPAYGAAVGPGTGAVNFWSFIDSYFNTFTHDIQIDASILAPGWRVVNLSNMSGVQGMNAPGTVTDGWFDWPVAINIGTPLRNVFRNFVANLTLGVGRSGNVIFDHSGALLVDASIGVNGAAAPGQLTGWGTPVGGAVINNYNITDAGGANSNTNKVVAKLIAWALATGTFGA